MIRNDVHKYKQDRFRPDLRKNVFTLKKIRAAQKYAVALYGGFQATTAESPEQFGLMTELTLL